MGVDDSANRLERQTLGCRIDRKHFPALDVGVLVAELDELAWLELPPVEETHSSGEEHHVALLDGSVEERLAGPRCFDHPALVLQYRLKDSESLAGRDDAFRDDLSDDGPIHPRFQ